MKEITRIGMKSGATHDIEENFELMKEKIFSVSSTSEFQRGIETPESIIFVSEIESITKMEQQEEKMEITKEQMFLNINQMEKDLEMFKSIAENLETESITVSELSEKMSKIRMEQIAKEPVETWA